MNAPASSTRPRWVGALRSLLATTTALLAPRRNLAGDDLLEGRLSSPLLRRAGFDAVTELEKSSLELGFIKTARHGFRHPFRNRMPSAGSSLQTGGHLDGETHGDALR